MTGRKVQGLHAVGDLFTKISVYYVFVLITCMLIYLFFVMGIYCFNYD
jgi:hypothetical protein